MKSLIKILSIFAFTTTLYAAPLCTPKVVRYGDGFQYQESVTCSLLVSADKLNEDTKRYVSFTDEGAIQVMSNFPASKNADGARVFYLFPNRGTKSVAASDKDHLSIVHPSGAVFNFDKNGRMSSPDLKMSVSKDINGKNNSGVEIESYPDGIIVDIGYRTGGTPTLNKNAVVTITDKNKNKCKMVNSDLNKITRDDVELIYKTNESLHRYLVKKCPGLDVSDLLKPMAEKLEIIAKPSSLTPVLIKTSTSVNDSKRADKPQFDDVEKYRQSLDKAATSK